MHRPTTAIATLEQLVSSSEGTEKTARRATLDALLHTADAWQTLLRADQKAMAKSIDRVAQDLFLSSWNAVAAEVFLQHTPCLQELRMRRQARQDQKDHERCGRAVESARRDIALAWDLLEGIKGPGQADAETLRKMAVANFGETEFRGAMVEARMRRLEKSDPTSVEVDGSD